ncbi:MAG: HEAT repeat domain-containing protein [Myxococcales bacterium]|nr:HEAT repeat domain-containing protein [Myxococcales bacterium]
MHQLTAAQRRPRLTVAIVTCIVCLPPSLMACGAKTHVAVKTPVAGKTQPKRSKAASARLARITKAKGRALCKLSRSVVATRDASIMGPVLDLAFQRRRNEQERSCMFELLLAMKANAALLTEAQRARTTERWLAVLAWAGRNLRAKHFGVYALALKQPDPVVRRSAVAQLARHRAGPRAIDVLRQALADPLASIRLKAVAAAGRMNHPAVVSSLRKRAKIEKDAAVLAALKKVLSR